MRKLIVFNNISLDGCFTDANGDMSWAHRSDAEFDDFTAGNARQNAVMVFGRVTYELMMRFWPTQQAMQTYPDVARSMNESEKIVFSSTLARASWKNTRVLSGDVVKHMRSLKAQAGPDLLIMGSGTLVAPLTEGGLVDEFQLVLCPLVLGAGRTLFEGVTKRPVMNCLQSRTFSNGNVFLRYAPAGWS